MIWLGPMSTREAHQHEPDAECNGTHCYSCNVDHRGSAWQWCIECGHAYHDQTELVRAYRQGARLLGFWFWLRIRLTPARRLVDRIYFCPLCMHDF